MEENTNNPIRVAIVGSGLAGLVTAYLLHQDTQSRYAVTLFEEGKVLSLDSASLSLPLRNDFLERIDLPMRSFSGAYYKNLTAMYNYLGAQYEAQSFTYRFSKNVAISPPSAQREDYDKSTAPRMRWTSYFVHFADFDRLLPQRPEGMRAIPWLIEIVYVLICYLWYSAACCWIEPRRSWTATDNLKEKTRSQSGETFQEYLSRIRLPQYFVTYYVLPILSTIATCSHRELLNFPASDLTEYKRLLQNQRHCHLSNGVQDVQDKLGRGIDTRLSTRVSSVQPLSSGEVRVQSTTTGAANEELFDRVILAVSPNVVAKVFSPLQNEMAQMPTVSVESTVHTDSRFASEVLSGQQKDAGSERTTLGLHPKSTASSTETIHFRTSAVNDGHGKDRRTEAVHVHRSGAIVTTCPISYLDPAAVVKTAKFTRVLRTPESRRITNRIFDVSLGGGSSSNPLENIDIKGETRKGSGKASWKNGDGNVWLVGSWCWDGMVLLEGCVVSAMRVADAFDVHIPWLCAT